MKKELFRYIFSFLILSIISINSFGQDENIYVEEGIKEPLQIKGVKFGVNAGRFSDYLFKPERISYEGSIDINLCNKYFGVIEAGYSEISLTKDNYSYISDGYFIKAGMDYNLLKAYPTDFLGIGFRFGNSVFSHSANDIIIESEHWSTTQTSIENTSYNVYWFEASFGVKGEVLKNIYLGWSALVKIKLSGANDENFSPYDIPGFGGSSELVKLGVTYYIYYQIPFNRK
ncbi:MAG: hypothetical protein KOO66_07330 [Bacteroidales bacterium]|nr:hypothetical protein [Bacteroidales bacterium]